MSNRTGVAHRFVRRVKLCTGLSVLCSKFIRVRIIRIREIPHFEVEASLVPPNTQVGDARAVDDQKPRLFSKVERRSKRRPKPKVSSELRTKSKWNPMNSRLVLLQQILKSLAFLTSHLATIEHSKQKLFSRPTEQTVNHVADHAFGNVFKQASRLKAKGVGRSSGPQSLSQKECELKSLRLYKPNFVLRERACREYRWLSARRCDRRCASLPA